MTEIHGSISCCSFRNRVKLHLKPGNLVDRCFFGGGAEISGDDAGGWCVHDCVFVTEGCTLDGGTPAIYVGTHYGIILENFFCSDWRDAESRARWGCMYDARKSWYRPWTWFREIRDGRPTQAILKTIQAGNH